MTRAEFGRVLAAAREDHDIAVEDMSDLTGLGRTAIRALEAGDSRVGVEEYVAALQCGHVERGLLLSAANLAWGL